MSQLTYPQGMSAAFAGMRVDNGEADIASKVNPLVAIPFGLAVCAGVAPDRDVKLPTSSGEAIASVGVALSDTIECPLGGSAVPQFPVKSAVPTLRQGRVWVKVEEAVTPASAVYIRYASGGGGTQLGSFRASADTATAALAPAGWAYRSSAGAAGFAILEINLP